MLTLKESLKHYTTVQLRKAISNYNKEVKISGYSKLQRNDLEKLILLNSSKFQHMILEKVPEEKKKVKKPMEKKEEKKEVKPIIKKEEQIDHDKITKYEQLISELTHSKNKDFLPNDEILNIFNSFNPTEKQLALSSTMDYFYIVQKKFNDHYKINEKIDFSTRDVKIVEENIQKFYKIVKEKKDVKPMVKEEEKKEDYNTLSQELTKLILFTELKNISKALVKLGYNGKIENNKISLTFKLLKTFNTVNKIKKLINELQSISRTD